MSFLLGCSSIGGIMGKTGVLAQYSKAQLQEVVSRSKVMTDVIKFLGLSIKGTGNYRTIKKRLNQDNIDFSHFSEGLKQMNRERSISKLVPLENVLVENSSYSREALKRRLIRDKVLKHECYVCGNGPIWNDKPLVLQMDHINGISDDNRIQNLRMICPNCHTQTSTFGNRGKKKPRVMADRGWRNRPRLNRRIVKNRPTKEQLESQIAELGYCGTARLYSVSDNAIRKWLK